MIHSNEHTYVSTFQRNGEIKIEFSESVTSVNPSKLTLHSNFNEDEFGEPVLIKNGFQLSQTDVLIAALLGKEN